MRTGIAVFVLLLVSGMAFAQGGSKEKYWVEFLDKGTHVYTPEAVLSPRALDRRARHGVAVTAQDHPVNPDYVAAVRATGAEVRYPSRWFNSASAWMDAGQVAAVRALPFVKAVRPIPKCKLDLEPLSVATKVGYEGRGATRAQLKMVGLDRLHKNGYNGKGILISVMDNGFVDADSNPHLQHLFTDDRILATYDFVNGEADVFDGGAHGQWVLSILAGWHENDDPNFTHYGSAHGATYILCHTERDGSETTQEEDNWVAAMEWADSLGADVFSTSLGYRDFDGGVDYGYEGMDGNTTIITRAADLAAARGIVVVNSAGNSGATKITAPADGDSVIAIGAVDSLEIIAGFSGRGPSYDGRIKPDVCAMGVSTAYLQPSGNFSRGNGTSFSCPVVSGLLACLLQVRPETQNMDLYEILIRSADRYEHPDSNYGYGIPDGAEAYRLLTGEELPGSPTMIEWEGSDGMFVYPNPAGDVLQIAVDNETVAYTGELQFFDSRGALVLARTVTVAPFLNVWHWTRADNYPNLASGKYLVRLRDADSGLVRSTSPVIILDNR